MEASVIFGRTRAWAAGSDTARGWRDRRYRLFTELCRLRPEDRILDVGAGRGGALECFNRENEIVAVDLVVERADWLDAPNVTVQQADGTDLPFADREFPVVFSNSVIEHVPKELQAAFAAEVRRVGQ